MSNAASTTGIAAKEQKFEETGGSFSRDLIFRDSEGLIDTSIIAEEAAVMADVSKHTSEHTSKKKRKSRKKMKRSSRRQGKTLSRSLVDGATESAHEGTDTELLDRKKKKKSKRKKSQSKLGRDDDSYDVEGMQSDAENKHRLRKDRRKSSKRKRKRKAVCKNSTKDIQERVIQLENIPGGSFLEGHHCIVSEESDGRGDYDNLPPDLDTDSSSSELPDPSDLELEEDNTEDYESDETASSIEPQQSLARVPRLLGDTRLSWDADDMELSSRSMHSLPPQSIPGSIAKELTGSPSERIVESEGSEKRKDWKCRLVIVMTVLLVGGIVAIAVSFADGATKMR